MNEMNIKRFDKNEIAITIAVIVNIGFLLGLGGWWLNSKKKLIWLEKQNI